MTVRKTSQNAPVPAQASVKPLFQASTHLRIIPLVFIGIDYPD